MPIATLTIDLVAKLSSLDASFSKASQIAEKNAKKMEEAFSGVGKAIQTITMGVAGYASLDAFKGLIKSAIDAQDNLKDLSKATGVSISDLAGLGSAADKSGSDLESIAQALNKLSVNMGKDPAKFKEIGVTAREPIDALKQLADVFVGIKDPQERAAVAAEALGKSWQGVAPLLAEGGQAIGEMVDRGKDLSKVTEESAAKADALNDTLVELKASGNAIATDFANLLIPSLAETANKMVELSEKGHPLLALLQGFAGLGKLPFDLAFGSIDTSVAGQIKDLEASLKDLQSKRESYNPFVPWGDSLKEIDQKILVTRNQLEALQKYGSRLEKKPVDDLGSPNLRPSSGVSESSIQKFIGGEKKDKAESIKELTASTKDFQSAMESLSSTLLNAQSSMAGLDSAQQTLHKLMASPEWETYSEAMKWSAIEQAGFASGALSAADAQKRLNDLMADTPTAALEKAQADVQLLEQALSKAGNATDYKKIKEALDAVYTKAADGTEEIKKQSDAAKDLGMSFSSAFENAIVKGEKFSTTLQGLGEDILRIVTRMNITEPLAQAFSGSNIFGDIGSWFSNLFANANGGVYSSPSLSTYSGGVYNSPHFFKFASGAGVFGEAGPEAIMPLKRGSDGKLGVAATGGGSNVIVNVIEAPGAAKAGTTQTREEGGKTVVDVFVEQIKAAIAKDIGQGGTVAVAMEGQYGLNRAAGAWR